MLPRNKLLWMILITVMMALGACQPNPASVSEHQSSASEISDGPWALVEDESGMTYISIKNGNDGEINTFRSINGQISSDGAAEISILLDSVDTNNPVRDERMRTIFFNTEQFRAAKVTAGVDMNQINAIEIGASHTELLEMTIDLHGVKIQRDYYVLITRLGPNKLIVNNKAPLLLQVSDFNLTDELEELRKIAGLEQITPLVSVTMSLTFAR